jgi:SAM-dependent methyltransferase
MRIFAQLGMITAMQTDVTSATRGAPATFWARTFPVLYDPFLWVGERAGVRALRGQLLRHARGCTVEIGAGTGLNLPHYPDDLGQLILAEPDDAMRSRLEKSVSRGARRPRLTSAPAERLPFPDTSVDTVVSTFVLCTVESPQLALREIVRVLRPHGQLLFLEHVRSESSMLARWQDRLAEPWQRLARGCRCNRTTAQLVTGSGLVIDDLQERSWRAMPPIVRPLIVGRAHMAGTND